MKKTYIYPATVQIRLDSEGVMQSFVASTEGSQGQNYAPDRGYSPGGGVRPGME